MKFLLDENIGKDVANFLINLGYSVFRVRIIDPGIDDSSVLDLAIFKESVLITSDKDFGQLVFKEKHLHSGVILLRLKNQTSEYKILALKKILPSKGKIENYFTVVSEKEAGFVIKKRIK